MARRKTLAPQAHKHRNVLAVSGQHAREHLPMRDAGMHDVNSGGRDDVPANATEDRPREEFHAFDNNNDSKYLHKKFKKMASAVQSREDGHSSASVRPTPEGVEGVENDVRVEQHRKEEPESAASKESPNGAGNGKHVCPYCKLICAKPSVLQKHIRAHTNERPYPCVPCGFAFKTKSNLYKHCRSRSHALRLHGTEDTPNNDEEWSLGSDADASLNAGSSRPRVSSDSVSQDVSVELRPDSKPKTIYKPKFHKASFYREEDDARKGPLSPNPDFLNRHISKIISDNEAIVDTAEVPLQRKHSRDGPLRHSSVDIDMADYKSDNQPLNLTKNFDSSDANGRKRRHSETLERLRVPQHPLNPEGSIIKDLLLKARAQASGILPAACDVYDISETLYVCPLCQISYKSADNLEFHRLYYCKGVSNSPECGSIPNGIVSDGSRFTRSESIFASKSPLRRSNKPENLVILKSEVSAPMPSPGPLLGNTRLVDTHMASDPRVSYFEDGEKFARSSSFHKRRTESQSSESSSSLSRIIEEGFQRGDVYSPPSKIRCSETPASLRSLEELSMSPMRQNAQSLQMFGGEVKITDTSGGTTTMRIEPTSQQSPTMISQTRISPIPQGPETSSVLVRSGLHSGATIMHNPPTPKDPMPSPHPQTPRLLVSIAPNISTPNLAVAGIPTPNMTNFQFPISSITAYNPLTLPPLSPVASPGGPSTILHSGKLIPYVPGIPGPNTLGPYSPLQKSLKINAINENANSVHESTLSRTERSFKDRLKNSFVPELDYNHKVTDFKLSHTNAKIPSYSLVNSLDKKENFLRSNSFTKTLPTIKINAEEPPVNDRTKDSPYFNKRIAQIKIDEILRKNSEILQKSPNSVEIVSPKAARIDYKTYSQLKGAESNTEEHVESRGSAFIRNEKKQPPVVEIKQFNFENLISKSEIPNKLIETPVEPSSGNNREDTSVQATERSETAYFKKTASTTIVVGVKSDNQNSKFLRPTSLPLKPGTFTPKKHHGITPNANTLPLISPETPRPAKAYGQLYLNGHAYTYLGLKCSTKVCYCTLNRLQPTYVPNQHSLSMYSNWQVCSESTPHPLGLAPGQAMSHYDSRHRPQNYTIAKIKQDHLMTHSSQWSVKVSVPNNESEGQDDSKMSNSDSSTTNKSKGLTGGFESNEEYTYVRGRGRGRYVCSECGIRCKKPSMLKKHIRTHTDVRPFTCKHCVFSFKTKGNLTKHMKSKAHYRKCCELGISPLEGIDSTDMSQGLGDSDDESDSDDDGNEGETESSDTDSCKSRLEHEAAHCLLSLWGGRPAPGLLTTARPTTYPYAPNIPNTPSEEKYSDSSRISPFKELSTATSMSYSRKLPVSSTGVKQECSKLFQVRRNNSVTCPMDLSKPVDLSKSDVKDINGKCERTFCSAEEVLTPVGEPDLLASLASSMDKLPQRVSHWNNDEPMLQAYLTEKALQDSRIKQCQYTNGKLRQHEEFNASFSSSVMLGTMLDSQPHLHKSRERDREIIIATSSVAIEIPVKSDSFNLAEMQANDNLGIETLAEIAANSVRLKTPPVKTASNSDKPMGTENAKFVASEYLKSVCGKTGSDTADGVRNNNVDKVEVIKTPTVSVEDPCFEKEAEVQKLNVEHMGVARKVVVGAGGVGFKLTPSSENASQVTFSKGQLTEDGKSICAVCNKTFSKPSQLLLHINIHYIERPFRCSACAVSFRTRGHLQKHERSGSHHNKVSMTSTFGAATTTNPRPFKCSDCKIAFRIHGHLAKHLRSKMHVMRLECLGKLPFGTFAEIERAGVSLTDIDTTDCDNSLASLQMLAQKLHEKDPTKLDKWDPVTMTPPLLPPGAESSDEEDPASPMAHNMNDSDSFDETHAKYSATNT